MTRRMILTAISRALVAPIAVAQQATTTPATNPAVNRDQAQPVATAAKAPVDDTLFLAAAADGGNAEVTLSELGLAVGGRPALVNFFDGHTALASAEGLRRAGVDGPREFAENAEVVCDADGRPTGALLELGAMSLVRDAFPSGPGPSGSTPTRHARA